MHSRYFTKFFAKQIYRFGALFIYIGNILEYSGWRAGILALYKVAARKRLYKNNMIVRERVGHTPPTSITSFDLPPYSTVLPGVLFVGYAQGALGSV